MVRDRDLPLEALATDVETSLRRAGIDRLRVELPAHDEWPRAAGLIVTLAKHGFDVRVTDDSHVNVWHPARRGGNGRAARRGRRRRDPRLPAARPARLRADRRRRRDVPLSFAAGRNDDGPAHSAWPRSSRSRSRRSARGRRKRCHRRPMDAAGVVRAAGGRHGQRNLPRRRGHLEGHRLNRAGQGFESLCLGLEGRSLQSGRQLPRVGERQGHRPDAGLPRRRARLRAPRPLRRRVHRADADAARRPARRLAAAATATAAPPRAPPPAPPAVRHRPAPVPVRRVRLELSLDVGVAPRSGLPLAVALGGELRVAPGPKRLGPVGAGRDSGRLGRLWRGERQRASASPSTSACAFPVVTRTAFDLVADVGVAGAVFRDHADQHAQSAIGNAADLGAPCRIVAHAGTAEPSAARSRRRSPGGRFQALRRHAHAPGTVGHTPAFSIGATLGLAVAAMTASEKVSKKSFPRSFRTSLAARLSNERSARLAACSPRLLPVALLALLALPACNPRLNLGNSVLWSARHETGDLSEWTEAGKGAPKRTCPTPRWPSRPTSPTPAGTR